MTITVYKNPVFHHISSIQNMLYLESSLFKLSVIETTRLYIHKKKKRSNALKGGFYLF